MIKESTVVELSYKLTNTKGETLDESSKDEPFAYLHGGGQIVPGLGTPSSDLKWATRRKWSSRRPKAMAR